jgi:Fe-S oxidoreductase
MLNLARSAARGTLYALEEFLENDVPIVVVEPSCLATFRDEFLKILPDDPRAKKLSQLSCSLAEHLDRVSWRYVGAPMSGHVSIHPHCHQYAVQGTASEVRVLSMLGFEVEVLDAGCCGLAGSFGFHEGHDDLSRKIAADRFLPMLDTSAAIGPVILDGFSCQLQAQELAGISTLSSAEFLASALLSGDDRSVH